MLMNNQLHRSAIIIFVCVFPWTQGSWIFSLLGQGNPPQNPFAAGVRNTEPLSPAQERQAFELPPGFEIELVASEPDISKPMNMASLFFLAFCLFFTVLFANVIVGVVLSSFGLIADLQSVEVRKP